MERDMLNEGPLAGARTFEEPSCAVTAADGALLVLDGGKTRVNVLRGGEITAAGAAYLCSAVYDVFANRAYTVGKDGLVYAEDGQSGLVMIRDMSDTGDIPWEIAPDGGGDPYLAGLAASGVTRLDGGRVFDTGGIVYRIDVNDSGILSFTDNELVYQVRPDGSALFAGSSARYGAGYFVLRLAVLLLAVAGAAAVLYIIVRLFMRFARNGRSPRARAMMTIAVSTVLTSVIVAASVMNASLKEDVRKNEYYLTQTALSVSNLSRAAIGGDLEAIDRLSDYGGPAFTRIRESLDPICRQASEQGQYLYYVLYKVADGGLRGVMDYENTTGVVYPLGGCPDGYMAVFDGSEPYLYDSGSDAYGSWTYAVAPVYDSRGGVAGLVEMGSNLDLETLRTRRQITDTVLSTAVLLVLMLLLFSEGASVMESFSEWRKRPVERGRHLPSSSGR